MILVVLLIVLLATELFFVSKIRDRGREIKARMALLVGYWAIAAIGLSHMVSCHHVEDGRSDIHVIIKGEP